MKYISTITASVLVIGLAASFNTQAFWGGNACRAEAMVDVRGATFDTDGDGKTTILETAVANPLGNLDVLGVAVGLADPAIAAALGNADATLTVFAPDNDAFGLIPGFDTSDSIFGAIVSDQGIVSAVLLHHVIQGMFDPRNVRYTQVKKSLLNQDLLFGNNSMNPLVNGSIIGCTGVKTDNGNVWFLNSVLQPQYTP